MENAIYVGTSSVTDVQLGWQQVIMKAIVYDKQHFYFPQTIPWPFVLWIGGIVVLEE